MTPSGLKLSSRIFCILAVLATGGCSTTHNPLDDYEAFIPTTVMDAPAPDEKKSGSYDPQQVQHGKYLSELLTCGTCHTSGALIGEPDIEMPFAGSRIGIAYSNPLEHRFPGVVYPPNLTPDEETGLGSWSDEQILEAIQYGINRHGKDQLSVMPWPAYTKLTREDAESIVAYLRSLAPVRYRVPDNVKPGVEARAPYVHFGVYRSKKLNTD